MSLQHAVFAAASSAAPVGVIVTVVLATVLLLGAIGLYLRHVHRSTQLTRTHAVGAVVGAAGVTAAAFALTLSLSTAPPASAETPPTTPATEESEADVPLDAPGIQLPTLSVE